MQRQLASSVWVHAVLQRTAEEEAANKPMMKLPSKLAGRSRNHTPEQGGKGVNGEGVEAGARQALPAA